MKTAIAEPTPKFPPPANAVCHIANARTFACPYCDSGASANTMSKTLRTLMIIVMKTTVSTGASSGTVTRRNTCHSFAPVGTGSLQHIARHRRQAGRDHDHGETGPDPDVGDQE
jgi:hypothetical protein